MIARILFCAGVCTLTAYPDLLIRNATVVDVASGGATPKRSILIRGNRIAEVGTQIAARNQTQVIDGTGKFVIPGLWDMHVHLLDRRQLPLYPAYGVTGVRDMGSDLGHAKEWRVEIDKQTLIGPHIETCGTPVDGFPSADPKREVRVIRDANEARRLFDRLDDQGADFIGVLPRLPRDAYFAIAERARKYYSSVAGAVPATVSVMEAVDARQRSIDRMSGILLACSSEERRLREPRSLALERNDTEGFQAAETAAMQTFSAQKADALFQRMALYETRSVPMLAALRIERSSKGLYEQLVKVLLQMARDGVSILAGTDSGKPDTHPGEALHDELELLVGAGLTPAQALRSATVEPVKYIDATDSLGAIAPGKIADLVLLDGNPLSNIRNTRTVSGVVLAGQYINKSRLAFLRRQVSGNK